MSSIKLVETSQSKSLINGRSEFGPRHKLSRSFKEKGLSPITRSLQTFDVGDTVNVIIDP